MLPPIPPTKGPLAEGGVVFSAEAAQRVGAATVYVEKMYRNPPPPKGDSRGSGTDGRYAFLAAGATITGASGSTLGSGMVQLCKVDPVSNVLTGVGATVKTRNAGGAVAGGASGAYVKLGWANGAWSLDVVLCS